MKEYYVIATRDHASNTLVYVTGKFTCHGSVNHGDVLEAKLFTSLEDVCNYITHSGNQFMLGCSIVCIADVTFEKLQESYNGDRKLYRKYHDPNYAIS